MNERLKDNVILFPKTVEYYQFELTRLLEAEQYGDAIKLLRFLLTCQSDDGRAREEWQSLLDWLHMMFPDLAIGSESDLDQDLSESDLLREHLSAKGEHSAEYAHKLLESLREHKDVDKLMLALDQLAFLDHPEIDQALLDWFTEIPLHPIIQFKTLQTLKKRGVTGTLPLNKNGETAEVHIEDTPAGFDQFPSQIQDIIHRVQEISETKHPALSYFAGETWHEFLAFIYGTSFYYQMLKQEAACVDVWAAALHLTLLEHLFEGGDKTEILDLYGITSDLTFQWEQAYRLMQQFAANVFTRRL
ncbi:MULTISPECIES: hypothetical protein [unclassified Paenibacillus]|uniref:hypothetical protein n=1 Tax=unclassified Paenibacillus TaxID=185978 RepID=UPI001AE83CA0|nr:MULTISPECIES: hypothetical protein [unclassified Paenibacillus]MBP1156624.1 hypothetical protein [Paenibacillus sp. PvP091]MBP1172638.1 hypothetical protein [Paenibacillus sp. PvR098]MBP2439018.1 hypothetical protein [Paenibacillus sp. PvP052]